ncbi:MAG: putative Co/Zn/Cd efflux system membrane fusion protein [Candidatus Rifleibacterium amylolyticum]|nr:MAG: putative Co/Zn/Cd efflux system membrane fusion protein [Candidatus Rifleibacterium amylolyticum]
MKTVNLSESLRDRRMFSNYIVLILTSVALIFSVVGCKSNEKSEVKPTVRPVKVFTVKDVHGVGHVSLPAKTRANQRVDLSFKVPGPLIELPFEEGQEVKEGQLIARIDPRDYETNVNRIKSSLAEAKAGLQAMIRGERAEVIKMLESEVAAAEAEALFAEDQYKRFQKLWLENCVAKADFEHHTRLRNTAKARLEAAEQNLARGKKGARKEDVEAQQHRIRGLEANLKAAQDALEDTCLRAPFAGVVARRYVQNYQEVQAKQPIAFLHDISKIEILVDVPENLAVQIRDKHEPVVVARFDAAPDKSFPLTFKELTTEADPHTQTYQAVMVMPRPEDINILPGMTATIEGKPGTSKNVAPRIVIPAVAVTMNTEQSACVWVLDDASMTVKKAVVRPGEMTGTDSIVILEGLNPGTKVVVAGVTMLRDGMKVAVWNDAE